MCFDRLLINRLLELPDVRLYTLPLDPYRIICSDQVHGAPLLRLEWLLFSLVHDSNVRQTSHWSMGHFVQIDRLGQPRISSIQTLRLRCLDFVSLLALWPQFHVYVVCQVLIGLWDPPYAVLLHR